jgi:hypothetical protein
MRKVSRDEQERLTELVLRMRRYHDELIAKYGPEMLIRNVCVTLDDAALTIITLGLDGVEPK